MNIDSFIEYYGVFSFDNCIDLISQNIQDIQFSKNYPILNIDQSNNIIVEEYNNTFNIKSDISNHTDKDNIIVVCIKDNPNILNFCLDQLEINNSKEYCDILVVDDRPSISNNKEIADKHKCMYISINNDKNIFNYSMLNNIGAAYAKFLDKKRIIFWNSDVWETKPNTLKNLIDKHISYNSSISGTKLIYPSQEQYSAIFNKYDHVLKEQLNHSFLTIQHGGITFCPVPSRVYPQKMFFSPIHQWRFYNQNYELASTDTRCFAVTGACHIINIDAFIELGGYSSCMLTAYQDIDLCQRAIQRQMKVYYFGSETLFHGETITNNDGKNFNTSKLAKSDMIIYDYIWQPQITKLLGMKK